jgi:hypothetical protein
MEPLTSCTTKGLQQEGSNGPFRVSAARRYGLGRGKNYLYDDDWSGAKNIEENDPKESWASGTSAQDIVQPQAGSTRACENGETKSIIYS